MSSYSPVQLFVDLDDLDLTRLNQVLSNQQWLKDNAVSYKYDAYGTVQNDGMKIAAGVVAIGGASTGLVAKTVNFGNFFTPGSRPIVVASLATLNRRQSWVSIQNRAGNSVVPDATGVRLTSIFVNNSQAYSGDHRINWLAIGY